MAHTTGFRHGTRKLFKKHKGEKTNINQLLKEFKIGQTVSVNIDSSYHKGMPHYRFQGRKGIIMNKTNNTYFISFEKLKKNLITNSAHIYEL